MSFDRGFLPSARKLSDKMPAEVPAAGRQTSIARLAGTKLPEKPNPWDETRVDKQNPGTMARLAEKTILGG